MNTTIVRTRTLLLPTLVRSVLMAVTYSFVGAIGAPAFCQELMDALAEGDIGRARDLLDTFGEVSLVPYANPHALRVLNHALESAFQVVELAGDAEQRRADSAGNPWIASDVEGEERIARLLEHVRPPRRRKRKPAQAAEPAPAAEAAGPAPVPVPA